MQKGETDIQLRGYMNARPSDTDGTSAVAATLCHFTAGPGAIRGVFDDYGSTNKMCDAQAAI